MAVKERLSVCILILTFTVSYASSVEKIFDKLQQDKYLYSRYSDVRRLVWTSTEAGKPIASPIHAPEKEDSEQTLNGEIKPNFTNYGDNKLRTQTHGAYGEISNNKQASVGDSGETQFNNLEKRKRKQRSVLENMYPQLWDVLRSTLRDDRVRRQTHNETFHISTGIKATNQSRDNEHNLDFSINNNTETLKNTQNSDNIDSKTINGNESFASPEVLWEGTTLYTIHSESVDAGNFTDVTDTNSDDARERKSYDQTTFMKGKDESGHSHDMLTYPETSSNDIDKTVKENTTTIYDRNVSTAVLLSLNDSIPSTSDLLPTMSDVSSPSQTDDSVAVTLGGAAKITFTSESQSSTTYSIDSSPNYDNEKLHTEPADSEISSWSAEYDLVTPNNVNEGTLSEYASSSNASRSHTEIANSSKEISANGESQSTTAHFIKDFEISTNSNILSDAENSTAVYKLFISNDTTPEFNVDNQYHSTNSSTVVAFPATNSTTVTDFELEVVTRYDKKYPIYVSGEAGPDWEIAKHVWQDAWEIHIYVFGSLFGLVGLYTVISFIRLWWVSRLFSCGYFVSIHVFLILMCFTRSVYLLYSGYGSSGAFQIGINHFLYSVTFPCITSAFSLLFYSLLKATKAQLVPTILQKLQVLAFIIVVHFMISSATAVLVAYNMEALIMSFVSHAYFITWGLFLFAGYVFIYRKLHSLASDQQKDIFYTSPSTTFAINGKIKSMLTLSTSIKVMLFIAVCLLAVVGIEVYAIVGIYKTYSGGRPEPWTWWVFHTVLRFTELMTCLLQSYVVSLPLRHQRCGSKHSCCIICAPCSEIFCCPQKISQSNGVAGVNDFKENSSFNSAHKVSKDDLIENNYRRLLSNQRNDIIPAIDVQTSLGSRPNSLLIIEDGYVRFQTDCDINKIVDSCSDLSRRPSDVHNMNTFLLRDGFANTGFSLSPGEGKDKNLFETDLRDKSRKSSMTSSEFFRVPSSVSLADSMENELEKAFESFKVDSDVDEEKYDICADSESKISSKESRTNFVPPTVGGKCETETSSPAELQELMVKNSEYASSSTSGLQFSGLEKTAKPLKDSKTAKEREYSSNPNVSQKLQGGSKVRTSSCVSQDSMNIGDSFPSITKKQENREESDHEIDIGIIMSHRRPSEGQGIQAAVLTSLLKSYDSGSSESIDV